MAYLATSAATRWAASAGIDLMSLGRNPVVAATFDAAIRSEAAARACRPELACRSRPPINVHDGGSGPAVVLINGWTASGLVWPASLVAALEREHRVVRIDNRGTGWSRHAPRPYTIHDLAGDARRVIDDLALVRPTVVGISMGGMIAQELAMSWPDRVGRLVLLGTRPPTPADTPPPANVSATLLSTPPKGVPMRQYLRDGWATVTGPGFVAEHPELIDEMAGSFARRPTPQFAVLDQARAITAWSGAYRLRSVRVPTTVVHGTEDPLIPVRNGMRLAQLIAGARYVELPRVGHLVPYEAAEVVVELVTAPA
jgi:3-oxoadipate enol-lactonase